MKAWVYVAVVSGLIAAAWVGCSDKKNAPDDDGGEGGAGTGQGQGGAGTSTGTTSGTGPSSSIVGTGAGGATGAGGGGTAVYKCNPVTNAPCMTGHTCDAAENMMTKMFAGFECFGPPNTQMLCQDCNNSMGPFCVGTHGCFGGKCARYCCDDGDCGTGKCEHLWADKGFAEVGLCVKDNASACDAPAEAPSKGSCVPGTATSSSASGSGGAGGGP
jgi:hypothetical protein